MHQQWNGNPRNSEIVYSISLFRAIVVLGMLLFGTSFGVFLGLCSYYFLNQGGSLLGTLTAYVLAGWFVGLFVGWVNRKTWGCYESTR